MDELTAGNYPHSAGGRKRGSLFGKLGARQEEVPEPRAAQAARPEPAAAPPREETPSGSDQFAMKPDPGAMPRRMTVPSDVVIAGKLTSRSETFIGGKIEGDATVEAALSIAAGANITGKVKAQRCRLDGEVGGNIDCAETFEIGESGVLNADAVAGNQMIVAGQVNGGIRCGGKLHLKSTARITGDIRARALVVEEGAVYNGTCSMTSKQS
jgi:cytoskeletal protein CcmA (bactofilin family)